MAHAKVQVKLTARELDFRSSLKAAQVGRRAISVSCPIRDVSTLFNDLVGLPNQGRRQGDPESLRCLEVYS